MTPIIKETYDEVKKTATYADLNDVFFAVADKTTELVTKGDVEAADRKNFEKLLFNHVCAKLKKDGIELGC